MRWILWLLLVGGYNMILYMNILKDLSTDEAVRVTYFGGYVIPPTGVSWMFSLELQLFRGFKMYFGYGHFDCGLFLSFTVIFWYFYQNKHIKNRLLYYWYWIKIICRYPYEIISPSPVLVLELSSNTCFTRKCFGFPVNHGFLQNIVITVSKSLEGWGR